MHRVKRRWDDCRRSGIKDTREAKRALCAFERKLCAGLRPFSDEMHAINRIFINRTWNGTIHCRRTVSRNGVLSEEDRHQVCMRFMNDCNAPSSWEDLGFVTIETESDYCRIGTYKTRMAAICLSRTTRPLSKNIPRKLFILTNFSRILVK